MRRTPAVQWAMLAWLGAMAAAASFARAGRPDPAFAAVPFEKWMAGAAQAPFRWQVRISEPQLSVHQRLVARVDAQLDGAEVAQRLGRGEMVVFVQINDQEGTAYQDHGVINLARMEAGVRAANLVYSEAAFFLPGDYQIWVAIYNTATREHAIINRKLRVPAPKRDPLPGAWRDLPRVEFYPAAEPPDSWYLPALRGRLHLPVRTRRATRVELVVNLTGSERDSASLSAQDRNLSRLLPALKAFSQADFHPASLNVTLLDLVRQRVLFQQTGVKELDWAGIKVSLVTAQPGKIDVKELAGRRHKASFFHSQVDRRVGGADGRPGALVILSGAVAFGPGEPVPRIEAHPAPGGRVFYIRFLGTPAVRFLGDDGPYSAARQLADETGAAQSRSMRTTSGSAAPRIAVRTPATDQLASTLKPLAPRIFDVRTPEQFRKALATVLAEIARM